MTENILLTAICTTLVASLAVNGVLVWYVKRLIQNIISYTEGVDIVVDSVDQKLEELEKFSRKDLILNDPDVMFVVNLIRDSKEELREWRNSFSIVDDVEMPETLGEELDE